ncbi:helix-turn-helix domain-containing protein [Trinickia mobilis]|uniref:helix-turn-helix domain-containing protein n=1 Tax=Trinickia mobilis TaxID=2816356 RepID=UPI001A8BFBE9|nr:helix-turn-helix transcriptional regulator [Trinickia mobilis]
MNTVGTRLREERLRIGLSQDEFAAVGGLGRNALRHYETGERAPDANFLIALRSIGVNVWYVLTGQTAMDTPAEAPTAESSLTSEEREILDAYNQLNEAGKASMQAMLATWINTGALTLSGKPPPAERRVKRLSENRRAALDARTVENVDRAMKEVERLRAERAARGKGE